MYVWGKTEESMAGAGEQGRAVGGDLLEAVRTCSCGLVGLETTVAFILNEIWVS